MKKRDDPYRDERLENRIRKKTENGAGQGILENYQPWTSHYEFSSKGKNKMIKGVRINRLFDLFSNLECDFYYLLEYNPEVYDIREQYPLLDRTRAVNIAEELGVRYPLYPFSHTPVVMTSDFYIVMKDGSVRVRTVKPKEELKKRRVLEKFAIEREYFASEGIRDWKIVTEDGIDRERAANIRRFRNFSSLGHDVYYCDKTDGIIRRDIEEFIEMIGKREGASVREICRAFSQKKGNSSAGYSIFKHLLAGHRITIDLSRPLDLRQPVRFEGGEIIVG